jgi:hypothetical protein
MYNESAAKVGLRPRLHRFQRSPSCPQFVLGSRGMPRRYYNYLPEFQFLHQASTVGSWILGLGFLIMAGDLFASLRKKMDAPANPWHSRTLEWQTASPPITHNFHEVPSVGGGPYDYYHAGGTGEERLSHSTHDVAEHGLRQHHFATAEQQLDTSKIGMWLFLATEILMFGGLFVGFGLMQGVYPEAWVAVDHHLDRVLGAVNTVFLLCSSFTMVMAVHYASTDEKSKTVLNLGLTLGFAFAFLVVKYFEYSHKFHDGLLPGRFFNLAGIGGPPSRRCSSVFTSP